MKSIIFVTAFLLPMVCLAQFNISGKLQSNQTLVENCSVKLTQSDKVIKASVSDENGNFEFQNIPEGNYRLEIISVFYNTHFQDIIVKSDVSLGIISISEKTQELEEVVISARKNPVTSTNTGTLIDVAGSRLSNQENIFSVLNYAPSISTINGLKIFGSDDILIVLDGKELYLNKDKISTFLDKISVKSIQNIEIIDRSDASFDASKSGVIKINTIQKDGWTGSFTQSIFSRKKLGYTSDADLFYSNDKFRIFGNFYHSRSKYFSESTENQLLKSQNILYKSSTEAQLKRKENSFMFGADYYLNENTDLSFLYIYDYDVDADHNRNTQTDIFKNNNFDYLLNSRRLFDQISKDHSFSLNFNNELDTLGSDVKIALDFMNKKYINPLLEEEIHQQMPIFEKKTEQNSNSNSFVYVFSTSWNKKWANKQQFSLGTRLSLVDNKDYFEYLDIFGNQKIKNTNFSNVFFLKEYILAVFSRYNFPVGEKSNVSLGVRSEYNYNDFTNTIERYNNDNTKWLFNAQYNSKLWGNNFYISAVKRFNRVNYYAFNPTYIKSSSTSAYSGNKDLKPIDIYQLQTGYKIGSVNLALVYRYFENNILYRPSNINGILTTRPENIGYRNDFYIFASTFQKFTDWWEMNLKLTGGHLGFKLPSEKFSSLYAEAHITQNFYLPLDMQMRLDYSYTSDNQFLYAKNYYNHSLNMYVFCPLSKSFKLGISFSDIFNTSCSKSVYDFNNVYNYSFSKGNTRSFGVSLTYDFSKGKEVDADIRGNSIENEKSRLR